MIITQNRTVKTQMATFNSTRKQYVKQWQDGKIWFNKFNPYNYEVITTLDGAVLSDNFSVTQFYTDKQKQYLTKQVTWAWTKCFLSAKACEQIILNTDLKDAVEHYAIITHDKDAGVPAHTHMLIKFYRNERIQSRLVEYFHVDNVSSCEHQAYVKFKYLTHDSDKCRKEKKYQYNETEVISDDLSYFKKLDVTVVDSSPMNIIDAILAQKSERYLVSTFGRDYILNKARYWDCARSIASEESLSIAKEFHVVSINDDYVALYHRETGLRYGLLLAIFENVHPVVA